MKNVKGWSGSRSQPSCYLYELFKGGEGLNVTCTHTPLSSQPRSHHSPIPHHQHTQVPAVHVLHTHTHTHTYTNTLWRLHTYYLLAWGGGTACRCRGHGACGRLRGLQGGNKWKGISCVTPDLNSKMISCTYDGCSLSRSSNLHRNERHAEQHQRGETLTGLWACNQAMNYRGYKEDGEPGNEAGWSWK